jgi:hypothetical protein
MPNYHVLRIANERSDAADIRTGRERDKVGEHGKLSAPDNRDHQWREHQTDSVINE